MTSFRQVSWSWVVTLRFDFAWQVQLHAEGLTTELATIFSLLEFCPFENPLQIRKDCGCLEAAQDFSDASYKEGLRISCLSNSSAPEAHIILHFPDEIIGPEETREPASNLNELATIFSSSEFCPFENPLQNQ